MTACAIITEELPDGRYRATCSLLPDYEALADTEDEARQQLEKAVERFVRDRLDQT